MSHLDRRRFLAAAAGLGIAACGPPAEPEPEPDTPEPQTGFSKPLGAQLYTLRSTLPSDPAGILKQLAAIGYTEVEVLQAAYEEQKPLLADAGLSAKSLHLISHVVTGQWGDSEKPAHTTPEAVAEWLQGSGVEFVVLPYLRENERPTDLDGFKAMADKVNAAADVFHAAGFGFAYHNHAFEYQPMGDSTPLETLMAATNPESVGLEMDVFWVSLAGADPVEQLAKYSGRVPLVHLKDKAAEAPQQYKEGAPAEYFKEVGNGVLDFAAILRACESAGVRHYFVEQDQTPGDPLASLKQSYDNIRSLEV